MLRFRTKLFVMVLAIILVAVLLLPAQKLETQSAAVDPSQPHIVQAVAGLFPVSGIQDSLQRANGYTWAG